MTLSLAAFPGCDGHLAVMSSVYIQNSPRLKMSCRRLICHQEKCPHTILAFYSCWSFKGVFRLSRDLTCPRSHLLRYSKSGRYVSKSNLYGEWVHQHASAGTGRIPFGHWPYTSQTCTIWVRKQISLIPLDMSPRLDLRHEYSSMSTKYNSAQTNTSQNCNYTSSTVTSTRISTISNWYELALYTRRIWCEYQQHEYRSTSIMSLGASTNKSCTASTTAFIRVPI